MCLVFRKRQSPYPHNPAIASLQSRIKLQPYLCLLSPLLKDYLPVKLKNL